MSVNPYQSPQGVDPPSVSVPDCDSTWLANRKVTARMGIVLGGVLGLLGQVIMMVPEFGAKWFGLAALLSLLGLLWPGWRVRAVAAVLFIWLAGLAWNEYLRGEYYRGIRQRDQSAEEAGRNVGSSPGKAILPADSTFSNPGGVVYLRHRRLS